MTEEELTEIMEDNDDGGKLLKEPGCNALKGLLIIQKYLPLSGIEGASHDVIYGASVSRLVEAGITKEDAITLRQLNWMVESDCMACFV